MISQKKYNFRPLGKILHIVDNEAITKPKNPISAKNSKVYLETNEFIGILRDPFGNVDLPYQAIKLKNTNNSNIIGKNALASIRKKRRSKKRRYHKSKNKLT